MNEQGRILVVDREPEWRTFVAEVLRKKGYRVHLGSDAQTALHEITNDCFDLIIIDVLLLDWLDTSLFKQLCHRLLVVTAAPSVPEAIWAFRRGAMDYIDKTFDTSTLLLNVATALTKQPVSPPLLP